MKVGIIGAGTMGSQQMVKIKLQKDSKRESLKAK